MIEILEPASPGEIQRAYRELFPRVFGGVAGWHAPPMAFHMARLDPLEEPIWRRAQRLLLVARKDDRAVGRLLVFVSGEELAKPAGERVGRFAFFDTIDDIAVVDGLFSRGLEWLRVRGCRELIGPLAFSMHDEVGLLLEGFDDPPAFLMPFNPPHAGAHLARLGFREARTFSTYEYDLKRDPVPRSGDEKEERPSPGLLLRAFDLGRREAETATLLEVYNRAFERNWGFERLTLEECRIFVDQFIRFGDPRIVRIAEQDGRAVGFILNLPDPNRLLHPTRGQPDLWRIARLMVAVRLGRLRHLRCITLAVLPELRRSGIGLALIHDAATESCRIGYRTCELSYIDDGNEGMNRIIAQLGFPRRKRYAVYSRSLARADGTS